MNNDTKTKLEKLIEGDIQSACAQVDDKEKIDKFKLVNMEQKIIDEQDEKYLDEYYKNETLELKKKEFEAKLENDKSQNDLREKELALKERELTERLKSEDKDREIRKIEAENRSNELKKEEKKERINTLLKFGGIAIGAIGTLVVSIMSIRAQKACIGAQLQMEYSDNMIPSKSLKDGAAYFASITKPKI